MIRRPQAQHLNYSASQTDMGNLLMITEYFMHLSIPLLYYDKGQLTIMYQFKSQLPKCAINSLLCVYVCVCLCEYVCACVSVSACYWFRMFSFVNKLALTYKSDAIITFRAISTVSITCYFYCTFFFMKSFYSNLYYY